MPRIPDEHLRAVVFIYGSEEAAQEGEAGGGSGSSSMSRRHWVDGASVMG